MYSKVKTVRNTSVLALNPLLFTVLLILIFYGEALSGTAQFADETGSSSTSSGVNNRAVSESSQIMLSSEMIVDEVSGSDWSINYLVDEQHCKPENEMHPSSASWSPFWNLEKGPYHVYFDLGVEYQLTKIALHDMQDSKNLRIETGEPGNWKLLFTAAGSAFNSWVEQEVLVTSRYVRISMDENVYSALNEIILYGATDANNDLLEKSTELPCSDLLDIGSIDFGSGEAGDFSVDLNSVYNQLSLIIPDDLAHDFTIEIYNLNGLKVLQREFIHNMSSKILLDVSRECERNGVYILRYFNNFDENKTLKFIKRE